MQEATRFSLFATNQSSKFTRFSKILTQYVTAPKTPVIIFCDPGVDDVLMLLQILGPQTDYTVVGIVPVRGNASSQICTENTLAVCEYIGRKDVPVYPGKTGEFVGKAVYGDRAMGGLDLPPAQEMKAQEMSGIAFACNFLKTQKAVIVSTANLVEPAEMLTTLKNENPDALKNIIALSIMGGVFNASQEANFPFEEKKYSEANVGDQPTATKQVFDIAAQYNLPIFLSPLDLTHSILVSKTDIEPLANSENRTAKSAYTLINDVPEHYKRRFGKGPDNEYRQPLHDLHATMCLLYPHLYRGRWVELNVTPTLQSPHFSIKSEGKGNVFILSIPTMDRSKFIDTLIQDYRHESVVCNPTQRSKTRT